MATATQSTRIPLALQAVFIESNSGKEVHKAPSGNLANKVFVKKSKFSLKRLFFRRKKKSKTAGGEVDASESETSIAFTEKTSGSISGSSSTGSTSDSSKPCEEPIPEDEEYVDEYEEDEYEEDEYEEDEYDEDEFEENEPEENEFEEKEFELEDDDFEESEYDGPEAPGKSYISPQAYLDLMLEAQGHKTRREFSLDTGYSAQPTALQEASYDSYLLKATRNRRYKELKLIMESGISPNPCNQHGESLVHLVCRSGDAKMLKILLDAGSSVQVCDDYGRTPLHDACWRADPCFKIIEMLATIDKNLFFVSDCRGSLPLSYIPRSHWQQWLIFLESKKEVLWQPSASKTKSFGLIDEQPDSHPVLDPPNALSLNLARMVAAGTLSPAEARLLNGNEPSLLGDYDSESESESDYDESVEDNHSDDDQDDDFSCSSSSDCTFTEDDIQEIFGFHPSAR